MRGASPLQNPRAGLDRRPGRHHIVDEQDAPPFYFNAPTRRHPECARHVVTALRPGQPTWRLALRARTSARGAIGTPLRRATSPARIAA